MWWRQAEGRTALLASGSKFLKQPAKRKVIFVHWRHINFHYLWALDPGQELLRVIDWALYLSALHRLQFIKSARNNALVETQKMNSHTHTHQTDKGKNNKIQNKTKEPVELQSRTLFTQRQKCVPSKQTKSLSDHRRLTKLRKQNKKKKCFQNHHERARHKGVRISLSPIVFYYIIFHGCN